MSSKLPSASNAKERKKRVLDFNYKVLHYFGMWHSETNKAEQNLGQKLRSFIPAFQVARNIYLAAFHAFAVEAIWNETHLRTKEIARVVAHTMAIIKVGTLLSNRREISKVFDTFETLNSLSYYVDETCDKAMKLSAYWGTVLSKIGTLLLIIISFSMYVVAHSSIYESWIIPIDIWFPKKTYWYYIFLYFSTPLLWLGVFDLLTMFLMDTTMLVACMQIITQMGILRYKLENIRHLVESQSTASVSDVTLGDVCSRPASQIVTRKTEHETQSSNTGRELNDCEIIGLVLDQDEATKRNENTVTLFIQENDRADRQEESGQGQCLVQDGNVSTVELEMETYLTACVKQHEMLLTICTQTQRICNPVLRFQVILTAVLALISLYISLLTSKVGGINENVILSTIYLILGLTEFCILCVLSDNITEKSASIRDAAYACDWIGATEGFKRSLRIIMCRTIKPFVLRAMGIPLSLPTCKAALRAIYYIHTMTLNIINGKKITDKDH